MSAGCRNEEIKKLRNEEIKKLFEKENIRFLTNEPMANHTTFRIGGPAELLALVKSEEEILFLLDTAKKYELDRYIIGNGSNLLVSDKGLSGITIKMGSDFSGFFVDGECIKAQAGALLSAVSKAALSASLTGFEELSGIPASVGGGVYMNAGAYGGEIKDVTESVRYLNPDGEIKTLSGSGLGFNYRKSAFSGTCNIILSADFKLKWGNAGEIKEKMLDYTQRRKEKQPINMPSCGSAFKRPEGYFAAALIDEAGLKGYTVGGAQVSEKHSGFIVNIGSATADDVLRLAEHIKNVVYNKFSVELEPEMKMLGF